MAEYDFVIGIRNKVPYKISGPEYIVTDNNDYTITIKPDEEWDGLEVKTIYYAFEHGKSIESVIVGDSDRIPVMIAAGSLYIGISAGDLHTSRDIEIPVKPSVRRRTGTKIPPPTPDVYDQIMGLVNQLPDALHAAENAKSSEIASAESEKNAALSEYNAKASEINAADSAERAEQVATANGYAVFEMGTDGCLYYGRTSNIENLLDFSLNDSGELEVHVYAG